MHLSRVLQAELIRRTSLGESRGKASNRGASPTIKYAFPYGKCPTVAVCQIDLQLSPFCCSVSVSVANFLISIAKIPGLTAQRSFFWILRQRHFAFHSLIKQNSQGFHVWASFEFILGRQRALLFCDFPSPRPAGHHTIKSIFRSFGNAYDTTIESSSLTARQHWVYASSWVLEGFDGFETFIVHMGYSPPWCEVAIMSGASPDLKAAPGPGIEGLTAASWLSWDACLDSHSSIWNCNISFKEGYG